MIQTGEYILGEIEVSTSLSALRGTIRSVNTLTHEQIKNTSRDITKCEVMTSASIYAGYAVSGILQAASMALFTLQCVNMASTKSDEDVDDKEESEENHEGKHPEGNLFNFEPDVPEESMLVPTDNFDSFEQDPPPEPSTFEVESNLPKRQNDSENLPESVSKESDAV